MWGRRTSSAARQSIPHLREQAREDRRHRRLMRRFISRVHCSHLARRYVLGTFKGMKAGRRFGFLSLDDGSEDCFAHIKDNPGMRDLQGGEPVLFDMEWDAIKLRYYAVDVCSLLSEDEQGQDDVPPQEVAMFDAMDGIDTDANKDEGEQTSWQSRKKRRQR